MLYGVMKADVYNHKYKSISKERYILKDMINVIF